MAHFAQAVTANVGHVVRELQAVASLCSLHALPEGKRIFTSLAYLVTRESHPSGRAVHVQQCGCGGNYQERHPGALRFVVKGQTELVALVPATPPKSGSVAVVLSKLPPGAVVGDVAAFAPLQAEGAEGGATVLVRSVGEVELLTLKKADVHSILPQPLLSAIAVLAEQRAAWQHRQLATHVWAPPARHQHASTPPPSPLRAEDVTLQGPQHGGGGGGGGGGGSGSGSGLSGLGDLNTSHLGFQGGAEHHPNPTGKSTPASKTAASPAAVSPPLTTSPDLSSPCWRPRLGRTPSAPNPFLAAAAIIANKAAHPRAYERAEARALAALKASAAHSTLRGPALVASPRSRRRRVSGRRHPGRHRRHCRHCHRRRRRRRRAQLCIPPTPPGVLCVAATRARMLPL